MGWQFSEEDTAFGRLFKYTWFLSSCVVGISYCKGSNQLDRLGLTGCLVDNLNLGWNSFWDIFHFVYNRLTYTDKIEW